MWLRKTFQKKLVQPVFRLLREGLTPLRISACIIVGLVISVFPMYFIPTLLSIWVSIRFKLNLPLVQSVNYLGGPLQIALFFPFIRLGERVFRAEPIPFSPPELLALIQEMGVRFVYRFSDTLVHAMTGWLITAPAVGVITFFAVYPWVRTLSRRREEHYYLHHPERAPEDDPVKKEEVQT